MVDEPRETEPGDGNGATDMSGAARAVAEAAQDIGSFIRSQREAAQVSLRQLSRLAGISNPYLSQIERGLRKPSADVLAQIAKGLRVSSEVLYMQAGILEKRPHSPVRDALLADGVLTERQKQVLIEIYESFCRENDPNRSGTAVTTPGGTAAADDAHEIREIHEIRTNAEPLDRRSEHD